MHGKTSAIHHDGQGVFAGLPDPFTATRYHSLVVEPSTVPDVLEVTARTSDGVIMGLRHRTLAVEGVQFHPESLLTPEGPSLLANFLAARVAESRRADPDGSDRRPSDQGALVVVVVDEGEVVVVVDVDGRGGRRRARGHGDVDRSCRAARSPRCRGWTTPPRPGRTGST